MTFWVGARWDDEAEIFRSESNITGLHVEAASLDEFQEILMDLVPELLAANYRRERVSACQDTKPSYC